MIKRAMLVAALALAGAAPSAGAAPGDPLWTFMPSEFYVEPKYDASPIPDFEGPCGLAVDSFGNFYVSDYYHHLVDVFRVDRDYITQASKVDLQDGPCGLAVGPSGELFVNDYHRDVQELDPSNFPPTKSQTFPTFVPGTSYSEAGLIDSADPTGVALDPAGTTLYVNRRTEVAAYDAGTGALLQTIGADTIHDAYGLAASGYPATSGYLYVPDAATDTVLIFDPATSVEAPVDVITGEDIPAGGFGSLEDSAIAVDDVSGEVYVSDTLGPQLTEKPRATIQVFDATGAYEGQLKDQVIDGSPVGLAVDNTALSSQGRVYVTSGNTEAASVIAYPPGAAVTPQPAPLTVAAGGEEGQAGASANATEPRSATPGTAFASDDWAPRATAAAIAQKGNLRVKVEGRLAPRSLPRKGAAPISVSVGGKVSTTDGTHPAQLKGLRIELNRKGRLETEGLPTCSYSRIQPASSQRALAACRKALVGQGSFTADITLAGQEPYPSSGKLLLFNAKQGSKPVLFGQIYAERPFATSFVIVFELARKRRGTYGTVLSADLPKALGGWGNLTGIEMTLQRRYRHGGTRHSFLSAGCPAPEGFGAANFPLARTAFSFAGGRKLTSVLEGECKVRS